MITGGEPLLFTDTLVEVLISIKELSSLTGNHPKLFIYTADCTNKIIKVLPHVDGIVLTLHKQSDIVHFIELNKFILLCLFSGKAVVFVRVTSIIAFVL